MKEFIAEVCRECGGLCCATLPVYLSNFPSQGITQYAISLEDLHGLPFVAVVCPRGREGDPCYYHGEGGCPHEIRPPPCRAWLCGLFNSFFFDVDIPWEPMEETGWITLILYASFTDMLRREG